MANKKKPDTPEEGWKVEGNPWDLESTPWGTETDYVHRETGEPLNKCRDYVILRYLMEGDTRPLAALFSIGRAPGPAVLDYLAAMLHPAEGTEEEIKYALKSKRRSGKSGPLPNPETKWINLLTSLNVLKQTDEDNVYKNTAFYDVAAMLPSGSKAYETVKAEYNKRAVLARNWANGR
jgi:hypothetical protein